MKPPLQAEDLFLSGLLLRHKIIDDNQLETLWNALEDEPGAKLGDLLVEGQLLDFRQRKAIARLLNSDAARDVLEGRADPDSLMIGFQGAAKTASSHGPAGPLDLAATQTYPEAEAERMAREGISGEGERRDLAATLTYPEGEAERMARDAGGGGSATGPIVMQDWEQTRRVGAPRLPGMRPPSGELLAPKLDDDKTNRLSESKLPSARKPSDDRPNPIGSESKPPANPNPLDLAQTLIDDDLDLDPPVARVASFKSAEEFAGTMTDGGDSDRTMVDEEEARTLGDSRASSSPGDKWAKTMPTDAGSYGKPLGSGSFAETAATGAGKSYSPGQEQSRWSFLSDAMAGSAGGGLDAPDVDLLSAAESGKADVSTFLTDDELTRARANSARHGTGLIGHKIGGYIILDKLGEGGQGAVYMAKQLSLNRYVAFKVLPDNFAFDPQFVDRFVHEAKMLARMSHSNVVRVFDVGRAGDMLYITMENIQGQSLKDLIQSQGQVALDVAINIAKQSCRALGRVKKEGIAHRDIKPGNILLDNQGEVKVVDFGLADFSQDLASRESGHTAGTPFYMPPEAFRNQPATHLSDQYSLGATLYHMIAGKPPYRGANLRELAHLHLEGAIPRASNENTLVPPQLDAVLQRMMAKKPEDRYHSFREVFDALEEVEMKLGIKSSAEDFLGEGTHPAARDQHPQPQVQHPLVELGGPGFRGSGGGRQRLPAARSRWRRGGLLDRPSWQLGHLHHCPGLHGDPLRRHDPQALAPGHRIGAAVDSGPHRHGADWLVPDVHPLRQLPARLDQPFRRRSLAETRLHSAAPKHRRAGGRDRQRHDWPLHLPRPPKASRSGAPERRRRGSRRAHPRIEAGAHPHLPKGDELLAHPALPADDYLLRADHRAHCQHPLLRRVDGPGAPE
jgi:hypothetical protein